MADSVSSKLYRLLSDGDLEKQVAAAIVIGEFAPKDARVVALLAGAATSPDEMLRLKAIEALGKIGTAEARDALYPLLSGDGKTQRVAVHAVAGTGVPAVTYIKKEMPSATLAQRRTFLHVLAAQRSKESMALILDIVEGERAGPADDVVDVFRDEAAQIDAKAAKKLASQVRRAMTRKGFSANPSAIETGLHLLNIFHDSGSVSTLLDYAAPEHAPNLRRISLHGLRWVLPKSRGTDDAVNTVLGYLDGEDFQNVVSPALEALGGLDLPDSAGAQLIALASSRHPLVRKFALSKMSTVTDEQVTRTLVSSLSDGDPMVRELASRSLQTQPGASGVLLAELPATKNTDLAWRMVHAVRVEDTAITEDALSKLMKTGVERLEAGDESAEPVLHLVQAFDPALHFESLHKRGQYWKKKEKYAEAESLLAPLIRSDRCTDDARFDLAVVSLKTSTATAGAIARDSDVALNLIRNLVRGGEFPVWRKLDAEKSVLDPNDYYYLGFHLVEGPRAERELGQRILNRLAEEGPRSKVGKSAKSKLRIEGLA